MERLSRFQFAYWLRTGRVPVEPEGAAEVKFNPNHDPNNGQFTFAGEGGAGGGGDAVLRTMGLPVMGLENPQPTRQAQTKQPERARPQSHSRATTKLKPIPGYSETGANSWRSANDQVFIEAAQKFNSERGLKPGDPKYIDPQFIKAWAMVESGGSKEAFLRDPLQVNNPGDWSTLKQRITGLQKEEKMSPATSAEAALKWLELKANPRDKVTLRPTWLGWERALERYNGRNGVGANGLPLKAWYRRQVMKLYTGSKNQQ